LEELYLKRKTDAKLTDDGTTEDRQPESIDFLNFYVTSKQELWFTIQYIAICFGAAYKVINEDAPAPCELCLVQPPITTEDTTRIMEAMHYINLPLQQFMTIQFVLRADTI